MSRKASIHIKQGHIAEFFHNTREKSTKNSIFTTKNNYVNNNAKNAILLYKKELSIRKELYTKRTGQKLQKKAITLFSSIINLDKQHTQKDLEKVVELLEKKLDTKVVQYALHKDEGHLDGDEKKINYHGHIMFLGLDSKGVSVRKKLDRKMLRDLQTEVAKILGMERGDPKRKAKRLDTYDYKNYKKREEESIKRLKEENNRLKAENKRLKEENNRLKEELAKMQDLKILNNELRAELKQIGAKRADYAQLEQLNKELKAEIKAKTLTIDELLKKLADYEKINIHKEHKQYDKAELEQEKEKFMNEFFSKYDVDEVIQKRDEYNQIIFKNMDFTTDIDKIYKVVNDKADELNLSDKDKEILMNIAKLEHYNALIEQIDNNNHNNLNKQNMLKL